VSAEGATVPRAEWRSYYGRPIVKPPVWKPEIPFYLFTGGLGGASAGLAFLADASGNAELGRRAWAVSLTGLSVSPVLLISDLGRPSRFLNMLRLFKVTSPMSVGSWLLVACSGATAVAAADAWTGRVPAPGARVARGAAAVLGLPLSTYTAALLSNTAVPVWHEARAVLPFVFGSAAASSAGAAAVLVSPPEVAAPARRVAVGGAVAAAVALQVMEHRLGPLVTPYRERAAGALRRTSVALTVSGTALVAARGNQRPAAVAGAALMLAGTVCERWSIFRAGFQSAEDPEATVGPQRRRLSGG
jgi:Polysulphide reductase, NrfD